MEGVFFRDPPGSLRQYVHRSAAMRRPLILYAFSLAQVFAVDLPSYLMTCSRSDPNLNECFERAANDAIPKLKDGVPSLGIPPMDPLTIPRISIKPPGNGRITLDLLFENTNIYNASSGSIKTRLDIDNNRLDGTFYIPHTKMISDYESTGKVLVVPIKGKGKAYIDIYGSKAEFTLKILPKLIKGKNYFTMDSLHYQLLGCDKMNMKFTNLLGNRALGESVNEVLNENWQELYQTVRPSFSEVFRQYFYDVGKRFFNKLPMDKIFPERK